jgi:hypothetical protein
MYPDPPRKRGAPPHDQTSSVLMWRALTPILARTECGIGSFCQVEAVGRVAAQTRCAPSIQRSKQAVNGSLQHQPVRAQLAGFSERLVSRGFERDDAAGEFPPPGLHVRYL